MESIEVGLSLGSNTGKRLASLVEAKKLILNIRGVSLTDQSSVYETEAKDVRAEFKALNFLNTILIIQTSISIRNLLRIFFSIERELGRKPSFLRNAPRVIDIDIIYAGQMQINEEELIIPHPQWARRRFVLCPLCEVRPNLHIPGQSGTVSDVLSHLKDETMVRLYASKW